MSKIELSLSSDYVPNWTIVDAVRELFQNALDQEAQNPENTASGEYNEEAQVLSIRSKKAVLPVKSLLLGSTTKADDTNTIGQFGEGYKVATLVLLRNDKQVIFYNYGNRETWLPRFVKSRRFGADVLTFFIDKKHIWESVPSNSLSIDVHGITREEYYEHIVPSNLHLQSSYAIEHITEHGEILSADTHVGMVYVNGLYVCKYDPYAYGYNFKPGQLTLDRDRKLASDFDLKWLASKMWASDPNVVVLIEKGLADVAYVKDMSWKSSLNLPDQAFEKFRQVHGPHAVPVTTQEEADKVPAGYRGVIVSGNYRSLIRRSSLYSEPASDIPSPLERLYQWYEVVADSGCLSDEEQAEFEDIYREVKRSVKPF